VAILYWVMKSLLILTQAETGEIKGHYINATALQVHAKNVP